MTARKSNIEVCRATSSSNNAKDKINRMAQGFSYYDKNPISTNNINKSVNTTTSKKEDKVIFDWSKQK